MKKRKNQLDERQEQKLLQIEHNGCWFAFWALLASLVIQQFIYGIGAWEKVIAENIIFICLGVYLMGASIKNGIWDRKFTPSPKVNLVISTSSGAIAGVIFFVIKYWEYRTFLGALASGAVMFFIVLVVGYLVLSFCLAKYTKRVKQLEEEVSDDEE